MATESQIRVIRETCLAIVLTTAESVAKNQLWKLRLFQSFFTFFKLIMRFSKFS